MADDKLSRLCSQVRRWQRSGCEAFEELRAFSAPSECGTLVAQGLDDDLEQIFKDAGVTPAEFVREVIERTSEKFLYFEFGEILDLAGGWPEPAEEA